MSEVKFALNGCGRVSSRHVDALTSEVTNAKIAALCDLIPELVEKWTEAVGGPRFTSTDEMYESVEINCVTVAAPSGDHYHRTMQALSHGKRASWNSLSHCSSNTGMKSRRLPSRRNLRLWVAFQNRYNPAVLSGGRRMLWNYLPELSSLRLQTGKLLVRKEQIFKATAII
jgi:UDP-N-acetyl-2-amino-2-deoxyglucuronate dehydrogenase